MTAPIHQVVRHGRVSLAVRHSGVREPGRPHVLLLHALYGSCDDWLPFAARWPGSFTALDFCGHGDSDWLAGRGYSPEVFAADADLVLETLAEDGPIFLAGAGVGAYVALLLAGGRPQSIRASLLLPGAGLTGGGALPADLDPRGEAAWLASVAAGEHRPGEPGPDPLVDRCERDVRPVYYAEAFARAAGPILIAALDPLPPWLQAVSTSGQVQRAPTRPADALAALASAAPGGPCTPPGRV